MTTQKPSIPASTTVRLASVLAAAALLLVVACQKQTESPTGGNTLIMPDNIGRALACFERTLVATDAPFDRYKRGDNSALTAEQVQGLNSFVASGCAACHSGPHA